MDILGLTRLTKVENMNCYEHTIITKQDLAENQAKTILNKYENLITKNSGKVLKVEEWGLRNLSYIIKKNKKGFYFHIKLEGIGKTIEELNQNIKKFIEKSSFNLNVDLCLSNKESEDHILEDRIKGAKKFKINATPTLIINGEKFDNPTNYKKLKKFIEKLI